ncbi:MAG: hypothetical protein FWC41_03315 [Firmicutes bacterium]|nr:hypothetical protein [Bacillota bacterium]
MNKKITLIFLLFVLLILSSCSKFHNNQTVVDGIIISYLSSNDKEANISFYNLDNKESSSISVGKTSDIFWACTDVYENGNIVALNDDRIILIDKNGFAKHKTISDRIVAVKYLCDSYLVISQYEEKCVARIWDLNFSEEIYSKELKGHYSSLCKSQNSLIISTYDEQIQETYLHILNYKNTKHDFICKTFKIFDFAAHIVLTEMDNRIFFCVRKLSSLSSNEQLNELFELIDINNVDLNFLYKFDKQPIEIFTILNSKLGIVTDMNASVIYIYDTIEKKVSLLSNLKNESIKGVYNLKSQLIFISNKAIYILEDNSIKKIHTIKSPLENQYN